jgi:hypothetical protein
MTAAEHDRSKRLNSPRATCCDAVWPQGWLGTAFHHNPQLLLDPEEASLA